MDAHNAMAGAVCGEAGGERHWSCRSIVLACSFGMLYTVSMNRKRREELGKVFFDVAKYLLTTTAVGSFLTSNLKVVAALIACAASFALILIAYQITPKDKEDGK